jgi:hypothetical protein
VKDFKIAKEKEGRRRTRKYDFCAHQHPGCDDVSYLCYSTAVALSSSIDAFSSFFFAQGSKRTNLTAKRKIGRKKEEKKKNRHCA